MVSFNLSHGLVGIVRKQKQSAWVVTVYLLGQQKNLPSLGVVHYLQSMYFSELMMVATLLSAACLALRSVE